MATASSVERWRPAACIATVVMLALLCVGCDRAPRVTVVASGFRFTEGPVVDSDGNLYFSDIPNNRIHRFSPGQGLTTIREDSGGANGLMFRRNGELVVCEGGRRRVVAIAADGSEIVLADRFNGKKLNSPNDLWIAPDGGIYFTDPDYSRDRDVEQDGNHVYYLAPHRSEIVRVINDMVKPNGLVGTPDGKLLYVADPGAGQTFVYSILPDGSLTGKRLFARSGSDGMTLDPQGNVYLTDGAVHVFSATGERLRSIRLPQRPTNVEFADDSGSMLYVTAGKSVYLVDLSQTRGGSGP